MINRKLIAIVGPTASGKTDLAIFLAKKLKGELISADSRQVYCGLDIGTGKDKSYPQHLIDICEPKKIYSVAEFQPAAYKIIEDIFFRGKIPILVGGTGLYLDAVLQGYQFPKEDKHLRAKLEKKTMEEIIKELKKVDPISVEKNIGNHRRLVRALEVYLLNKRPLSEYKKKQPNFSYLTVGIDLDRNKLYQNIDERVDRRIRQGMIEEVKNLLKNGLSHERLQQFGLEYRFIDRYLQGVYSKEEMIQKLKFAIHDFARRQLTWFRKNKGIKWVKNNQEAEKLVRIFLK